MWRMRKARYCWNVHACDLCACQMFHSVDKLNGCDCGFRLFATFIQYTLMDINERTVEREKVNNTILC